MVAYYFYIRSSARNLDSLGLWHSYREKSIFALVETTLS